VTSSDNVWKRVFFTFAVLTVVAGCAHSSTTPGQSPAGNLRSKVGHDIGSAQGHELATWIYNNRQGPQWDRNDFQLEQYLDFVEVDQSQSAGPDSRTFARYGNTVVEYTNPNRQCSPNGPNKCVNNPDPEYTDDPLAFAIATPDPGNSCTAWNGSRLFKAFGTQYEYQMWPLNVHLSNAWAQEMTNFISPTQPSGWNWAYNGTRSYVFEDVADNVEGLMNIHNQPDKPCTFNNNYTNWTNWSNTLITNTSSAYPALNNNQPMPGIIFNGLDPQSGSTPRPAIGLATNPAVSGGFAENCYVWVNSSGQAAPVQDITGQTTWTALENTEIAMLSQGKIFVCQGQGGMNDAAGLTSQRLYQIASYLLAYDSKTFLAEKYQTVSGYQIFPEAFIVPMFPVKPQPVQASDLVVNGGSLYGREYNECWVLGVEYTGCYVVVNPSTSTINFQLPAKYVSQIVIQGSSMDDVPAPTITSSPIGTSFPPGTAAIALAPTPTPTPSPSCPPTQCGP
jgi:hypothetical protein